MGFGIFMPALELPNFGVNEIACISAGIPFRKFGHALEIHIDPNVNRPCYSQAMAAAMGDAWMESHLIPEHVE
uniref:Uncharacterized protein n=1 Tax=Candidatus Kentrum sp. SD TaxID=2126332 RepID=A0A450YAF4_9GAMM|nr:MAG: hypothetical protein BECKSD772F_GA0070984_102525 [Candidatus Kentron sp. SD]VFK48282.1 MAG: hypothetical protein BECKSD772E_GA0070983_11196 [Candidatus Kentron sp. SD]